MAEDTTEDRRSEQVAEYGAWIATGPIYVGGALAYTAGHPVPKSNVEQYGYDKDGLVTRAESPEQAPAGAVVDVPPAS